MWAECCFTGRKWGMDLDTFWNIPERGSVLANGWLYLRQVERRYRWSLMLLMALWQKFKGLNYSSKPINFLLITPYCRKVNGQETKEILSSDLRNRERKMPFTQANIYESRLYPNLIFNQVICQGRFTNVLTVHWTSYQVYVSSLRRLVCKKTQFSPLCFFFPPSGRVTAPA